MKDRPIKDYPQYIISTEGEIRNAGTGRLLKQWAGDNGYMTVNLSVNGEMFPKHTHILLAETFLPNPKCKPIVFFLGTDKSKVRLCDLQWGDRHEAIASAVMNGKMDKKWLPRPVGMYTLDRQLVDTFNSINEASKQGYTRQSISACCNGRADTHRGHIWEYL